MAARAVRRGRIDDPVPYVAYYRVSTERQGRSGLGLEAQREAVEAFLRGNGRKIIAEFVEVESGANGDRPELDKAIVFCRLHGAILLVAKLDRLARNVAFVANLMEGGIRFTAVDMPDANELTVHIIAAMAQHERQMISERTKAALAAAKARGKTLGNPQNFTLDGRLKGAKRSAQARIIRAEHWAELVMPEIEKTQKQGAKTLQQLADALNKRRTPTPSGRGRWHPQTVRRILHRA